MWPAAMEMDGRTNISILREKHPQTKWRLCFWTAVVWDRIIRQSDQVRPPRDLFNRFCLYWQKVTSSSIFLSSSLTVLSFWHEQKQRCDGSIVNSCKTLVHFWTELLSTMCCPITSEMTTATQEGGTKRCWKQRDEIFGASQGYFIGRKWSLEVSGSLDVFTIKQASECASLRH